MANQHSNQGNSNRGFASMDQDKQRDLASQGGKAAHASGNANEFNSAQARQAGQKGGSASQGGAQASNQGGKQSSNSSGARGGSSEQHAKAGSQSHKNG